ncbi:flavoprotein [Mortierella sp. GBAus27b]|nr:flavoprotein [Mortierella sp. GBAus27b]
MSEADAGNSTSQHRKRRVLIGATGSVASVKIPIIEAGDQVEVKVVTTYAALHFFDPKDVLAEVLTDQDEWNAWKKMSDPVMHIELRNWADMFIICPLDANTLAKTCILRAWDERRPVTVCPAMNTNMWNHKFTALHLSTLTTVLNYRVIPPISKLLACGDLGIGAMAEYRTIVDDIKKQVEQLNTNDEAL